MAKEGYYSSPKKETYTYEELRPMFERCIMDRATYLGFFYKVMPRELFDLYGKKALWELGKFRHEVRGWCPRKNDIECFGDYLVEGFDVNNTLDDHNEYVELTDDHATIHMLGKCALVKGWEEMGLSPEEVAYLCEIACYGDYGHTDVCGLKGTFTCTSAQPGKEYCEFIIEKKDP